MRYQNFKSDFVAVHKFYGQDGDTKTQTAVPAHVRLTYFTEERRGCITVERNGAKMTGCSVSEDGMTLTANVPLSRKCLGTGELFCEIAEISADSAFPEQEKIEVTPVRLGVTLWPGKTDDAAEASVDTLLGVICPGAVRYDTAQNLTDAQKAQARSNIGANEDVGLSEGGIAGSIQKSGCQAISENSTAIGSGIVAGTKGFRWTAIDFTTKTITLAQPLANSVGTGALISIINDKHYDKCSKVAATAAKGATALKVESLPFTSIAKDTGDDARTLMIYSAPQFGDIDLGDGAHAEGINTKATQRASHAEGRDTYAAGQYSHAEGRETEAFYASHAEGRGSKATGDVSHAEGLGTYAMGDHTHAEGQNTHAVGLNAHAEGLRGWANGQHSHAQGVDTVTSNTAEHAEGKFNKSNKAADAFGNAGNTLHSVGIGESTSARRNAVEIMQNGDAYLLGVGGYDGTNPGSATKVQDILDAVPTDDKIVTESQIADLASENYVKGAITEASWEWQSSDPSRGDIDSLIELQNAPDDRALPLLCGQPPILFGAGTPKESVVPDNWNQYDPETGEGYNWNGKPSAVGQQYIDTTVQSGGRYVAARDGEWELKWINS